MSTRFIIYPDAFTSPSDDPRDDPQARDGGYDEKTFIAIMAPLTRLMEPSDFFEITLTDADPFVAICTAEAMNFQFRAYDARSMEDKTGPGLWVPGAYGPTYWCSGALSPYTPGGTVVPTFPNIFLNDGTDGTPPVPVAQGRTPAQVVEYAAAHSDQLYIGYTFKGDWESYEGGINLINISVGHSTAPVTA